MHVFITVDTEAWWGEDGLEDFPYQFDRWMWGRFGDQAYGIDYQLDLYRDHGIQATFFIEPIFSRVVGASFLEDVVGRIRDKGQDAQLHIHTEWLAHDPDNCLPVLQDIGAYPENDQFTLLSAAKALLEKAGANSVNVFRAGNYGASNETLTALARLGFKYDSSYNLPYLSKNCRIQWDAPINQPTLMSGVIEVPIASFIDRPGHHRHVQLGAVSFTEMRHALEQAYQVGWQSFVIVSHSFELLNVRRTGPDDQVIRRLRKLCRYLADNHERFETKGLGCAELSPHPSTPSLQGRYLNTGGRVISQLARRLRSSGAATAHRAKA